MTAFFFCFPYFTDATTGLQNRHPVRNTEKDGKKPLPTNSAVRTHTRMKPTKPQKQNVTNRQHKM